ncbi:hypothetical protein RSAG8_07347, partial [Rhizoctonia solani AG-8 WAC10335]
MRARIHEPWSGTRRSDSRPADWERVEGLEPFGSVSRGPRDASTTHPPYMRAGWPRLSVP